MSWSMAGHVSADKADALEYVQVVDDFRQAARNAMDAGFNGVEIHGANVRLPFLCRPDALLVCCFRTKTPGWFKHYIVMAYARCWHCYL